MQTNERPRDALDAPHEDSHTAEKMYAVTSAVARAPIAVAKKTNATVAKRAAAVKPVAAVKGANEKVRNRFFLVFEVRTGRAFGLAGEGRGCATRDASHRSVDDANAGRVRYARIG